MSLPTPPKRGPLKPLAAKVSEPPEGPAVVYSAADAVTTCRLSRSEVSLTISGRGRIIQPVAKYRIESLGELARQMEFTPQEARLAQVHAAEELLHSIDPLKAYPYDYLVHRITGYRPKVYTEDLLAGVA